MFSKVKQVLERLIGLLEAQKDADAHLSAKRPAECPHCVPAPPVVLVDCPLCRCPVDPSDLITLEHVTMCAMCFHERSKRLWRAIFEAGPRTAVDDALDLARADVFRNEKARRK